MSSNSSVSVITGIVQPFTGSTSGVAGTAGSVPTPASGTQAYFLRGDATWANVNTVTQNAQTGTTYTAVATDAGKMVTLSNAGSVTVTIPSGTFVAGDVIAFTREGAGAVTFVGSGVTINSAGGLLGLRVQYSQGSIWFESATVAYLTGDLV